MVLATGGAGWLYYPHTDCLRGATGDGMALAYAAGAELVDMEMVQFIPFAIVHPPSFCGILIGEPSVAGPHGVLLDGQGRLLLENVRRQTRAAVTRVMAEALAAGRGTERGALLLDMSGNLKSREGREHLAYLKRRGRLEAVRRAYGDKAYKGEEPWEVLPSAHYFIGGLRVDPWGATNLPGLYAAGQAAGGVHGANRLGSVSLAELFVFGRRAGLAAARFALGHPPGLPEDEAVSMA
ncbi:MAG: FAD-binding protein, partial [Firmicutes bacterium]|nr:FAD-binding protein [Bacillota bacterium]